MATPQFPFYSAAWNGFYNRIFYANVAASWHKRGFGFLLLALIITALPAHVVLLRKSNAFIEEQLPSIIRQVPTITIRKGEASIEREGPVYLKARSGEMLIKIDTDYVWGNRQRAVEGPPVLVTKDAFVMQISETSVEKLEWKQLFPDGKVIDHLTLESAGKSAKGWLVLVLLVIAPAIQYSLLLLNTLVYALLAMLLAHWQKINIGFGGLYQLGLVVQGCALLALFGLRLLAQLLGIAPVGWLVEAVLSVTLLWFSVRSVREWAEQEEKNLPPPSQRF